MGIKKEARNGFEGCVKGAWVSIFGRSLEGRRQAKIREVLQRALE